MENNPFKAARKQAWKDLELLRKAAKNVREKKMKTEKYISVSEQEGQTLTVTCSDPIVRKVMHKIKARSDAGMKKYGKTMLSKDTTLLKELEEVQEELMDACVYLERVLYELRMTIKSSSKQPPEHLT